jgi:hypothetical protein
MNRLSILLFLSAKKEMKYNLSPILIIMAPKVKRPTTATGKCTPIPSAKAAASNETKSNETKNKKQDTGDELDVKIEYEKVMHKSSVLTSNSWKDQDLTWQLIHCIAEDPIIRQGLFPGPGANVSTAKGGGLSKAYHHKELAARVFGEHPVYGPAFEQAQAAKEKNLWAQKIKNRIQA